MSYPRRQPETFVAVLTPPGRGAIAVVQVWGEGAVELADLVFRPARRTPLAQTMPGMLRLGRIGRGLGDEVVAVVTAQEPPVVEIQCHGGPAAVNLVIEAFAQAGAHQVEPSVWAEHAVASPIGAAAFMELARAPTLRTAEILLEQSQGALDRELRQVIREIADRIDPSLEHIDRIIARGTVGLRLATGWRVVISGRPNVGKSRLLNALAGYQRAIVDSMPGTTRDLVTALTAFDGWPVELVDTAGLRETIDPIERSGIARTLQETESADLVLQLVDGSEPLCNQDQEPASRAEKELSVVTKADLPSAWAPSQLASRGRPYCVVSAESGAGLEKLIASIVAALVPQPPEPGAGVPFHPAHLTRLKQARTWLERCDRDQAIQEIDALISNRSSGLVSPEIPKLTFEQDDALYGG